MKDLTGLFTGLQDEIADEENKDEEIINHTGASKTMSVTKNVDKKEAQVSSNDFIQVTFGGE